MGKRIWREGKKRRENNTRKMKVPWPLDPPAIIALDTELKEASS